MGENVRDATARPGQPGDRPVRTGSHRRAVLHAVWAVPAVIAVSAAPALATSTEVPISIESFAGSCRQPRRSVPGKAFGLHLNVVFRTLVAGTVTIDRFTVDGAPTTDISPTVFGVGAGSTTVTFDVFSSSAAKHSAAITYTFEGDGTSRTVTTSVPFSSFPGCA
jgi:hypothetical protein